MTEPSSVDLILDFLRRNRFTRAEAALRSELGNRPDLNGFLQKLTLEEKDSGKVLEEEKGKKTVGENHGLGSRNSGEVSKELIIKEIECGAGRNGSESKSRNAVSTGEHNKPNEAKVISDKSFTFSKNLEETVLNFLSRNFNTTNHSDLYKNGGFDNRTSFLELEKQDLSRCGTAEASETDKSNVKYGEEIMFPGEIRSSWLGNTSKANVDSKYDKFHASETKELDQHYKTTSAYLMENFADNSRWSRTEEPASVSSEIWKNCSVKTVFPFPEGDVSIRYDAVNTSEKREGKQKACAPDVRAAIKEQVDEVGRALFFGKSQGAAEQKGKNGLVFPLASENPKEEFPRLPPVKLKSEEKSLNVNWEEKYERDVPGAKLTSADNAFLIGSYLDVPIGQEISSSGGKRNAGGSWLSVSQGIAEDASDLVSGFATIGDGLSESVDYANDYWDSDEYDDDDDVGYMRQPIEDEAWFLAHEIDYPSDNEKGTGRASIPDPQERSQTKDEEDDQSFAEDDSYFSGEHYIQAKNVEPVAASDDPIGLSGTEIYSRTRENDLIAQYDGQLMDEEELNLIRSEPVWQGFVTKRNDLIMLEDGKVLNECGRSRLDDIYIDDEQHGSVRSIGVGINSDAADIGSEVRTSLVGESSEGDFEYFHDHDVIGGSRQSHHEKDRKNIDKSIRDKRKTGKNDTNKYVTGNDKGLTCQVKNLADRGFSFPPPLRDGQSVQAGSSKSQWSSNCNAAGDEHDDCLSALIGSDDMLATWRRKSSDSSAGKCSRDENNGNAVRSANSSPSSLSNYCYDEQEQTKIKEGKTSGVREDPGISLEDEEVAAVQEQVRQIKAQEEEFETFNLKIVHRKNRTGFEEDKNFHVVLNSVIAGRYHVTEYLGSAAFSKAIQAHDLHTGMDVCVKIIKNNKDFFDQSLDEIKLLKYVNKHDPADKHHLLRLYDYFYYREHLLIVCELLKANLYEFHKFNRESGGEVYFTMPRLQSITIQCLEALQFLHSLGLVHCDLKPENILVKSYSRCEVKVIDLGSSCFETDHLCSYVQSRSYRAPEVILGLQYDKKIDIWSLGCILAELCTGNVLFQNDSPATLLARVIGIIGPIEQGMLAKAGAPQSPHSQIQITISQLFSSLSLSAMAAAISTVAAAAAANRALGVSVPTSAFMGKKVSSRFNNTRQVPSGSFKVMAAEKEIDEETQTEKDRWKGLAYDISDDQQDITRGKGMVDSLFQAPMNDGTHYAVMSSYEYISQGLKTYNLDNNMDGFYIAPAFMDKLVVHISKNFMSLPNIKVPLILGIWGGKGQGKSFQCELVFAKMGINPIMMSAGELESGNAGEPAKLIRQRYREAADIIKKGKMCALFINDLDAGAGRMGGTTQYTVNNQMVNATLMNIADNPTNVQLPGMYNKEENPRVPIIVTGNDFSTLYAPLIRDGRMEKFYWAPTRDDRIGVCKGIFRTDGVRDEDIVKLVDTFPGQSIDFFGALRARVYDDEVRKWISEVGVASVGKKLVNSREGPPTFEQPKMTIEKLLEYGNMLVAEQENVKRVQLADKYLSEAALGEANEDSINRGTFYGKAAQQVGVPVPEGCTDPNADNFDPTARSDDGTCTYKF